MGWITTILSILASVFTLFRGKSEGEKAINELMESKNETINKLKHANKIHNTINTDSVHAKRLRSKYTRKDD